METKLDSISNRELEKKSMLNEFYDDFMCLLEKASEIQKEKNKEKANSETGTDEKEIRPKNVIRQFGTDADIVQTKYGPALFVPSEKKFISITPLMEWKEKTIETLKQTDITFLKRLPITVTNTDRIRIPIKVLMKLLLADMDFM